MLLSILEQPVVSRYRLSVCVHVGLLRGVLGLRDSFGLLTTAVPSVPPFQKCLVRIFSLLSFSVALCTLLRSATIRHLLAPL